MKILHMFYHALGKSPRPTRFYKELCKFGEVTVCSSLESKKLMQGGELYELSNLKPSPFKINSIKRTFNALTHQFEKAIWIDELKEPFEKLKDKQFQLIVCQDILALPLAVAIKNLPQNTKRCKLIMDAREFFPLELENNTMWWLRWHKLMDYICSEYLPKADIVFTVSPGLAQGFQDNYSVNCELLPSLSYYHNIKPQSTTGILRCIHHGNAAPKRKLELMIEAFKPLEGKATLDLMLTLNDEEYLYKLKDIAQNLSHINITPPVPMPEIVPYISQYDLGIYLLTPDSFNHKHALPNKLFEYIQARLGVIVSPVPDMANLVRERGVGLVTDDFTAESLTSVMTLLTTEQVDGFKKKSNETANELCWERNTEILQSHLEDIKQKCSDF